MQESDIGGLLLNIMEYLPFPVSLHSTDFRILYANKRFKELFGENVVGRKCYEVIHRTSEPIPECPHVRSISSGDTVQEVMYEKEYGMYMEVITVPISGKDGRPSGTLHIILDMTDGKVAEIELSRERNLLKSILEVVGALVVVLDREGRITLFNRACEELTGYKGSEVRGKSLFELLIPEDEREGVRRVFSNLQEASLPSEYENHWVTKSGERRLISWRNTFIADEEGKVTYIIGTGIDVTDQRKNEKAIERELLKRRAINEITLYLLSAESTKGMYNTLLQHLRSLLKGDLVFITASGEDEKKLKVVAISGPEEDAQKVDGIGMSLSDCYHLRGLLMGQTALVEDINNLQCRSNLLSIIKSLGYRSMLAAPLLAEGKLLGAIFLLSKKDSAGLQQNIAILPDLLPSASMALRHQRLLESVERMNNELQAAYGSLKVITKTLRHDILNQTTVLRGYLDLYMSKGNPNYLDKMKTTMERIENLIEEMRSLESLAGKGEGLKHITISEVLKEIRGMYSVEISLDGDATVMADEGIISLFQNLVHNSIIHGGARRVDVIVRPGDNGMYKITVRDDGKGIPSEIKERIFEEGFSYGERGGTGLGLYLAKKAVERYGGRIELVEGTNGGATFRIELKGAEGGYQHS